MVDPKDYEGKCNQTDIQEQWKPDKGDHVWDKDKECDGRVTEYHPWHLNEKPRESNLSINGILYKVESDGPPFARFVWLPTAAQLKQMVNFDQQDFGYFLNKEPYDPEGHPDRAPAENLFGSEEEYLLAYVMKRQFDKVWVSTLWYPRHPTVENLRGITKNVGPSVADLLELRQLEREHKD